MLHFFWVTFHFFVDQISINTEAASFSVHKLCKERQLINTWISPFVHVRTLKIIFQMK